MRIKITLNDEINIYSIKEQFLTVKDIVLKEIKRVARHRQLAKESNIGLRVNKDHRHQQGLADIQPDN